jgi:hypothetical protein
MHWTTTREALQTALAWGYLQKNTGMVEKAKYGCHIERSPGNNDNLLVASLEAGQIMAEISAQRPVVRAWLHFAYGPENNPHDQAEVAVELMWKLWKHVGGKWWSRYTQLCQIAALDMKHRILLHQPIPREVYLSGVKIYKQDWHKNGWETRTNLTLDRIEGLDKEGLAAVSCVVKAIRTQEPIHTNSVNPITL